MLFNGKFSYFARKPVASLQPGIGPRDPLRAIFVGSKCAKFFQLRDRPLWTQAHDDSNQKCDGSRFSILPRPRSPTNLPSRTWILPLTVTTEGLPSISIPSKP